MEETRDPKKGLPGLGRSGTLGGRVPGRLGGDFLRGGAGVGCVGMRGGGVREEGKSIGFS